MLQSSRIVRLPRVLVIALLALVAAGALHADLQPIATSDLLLLRSVSSIDVAHDGSKAVFAVRSIETKSEGDGEPRHHYRSHLFLFDLMRSELRPRQLTHGARNDSAPKLSSDGRHIAFLRASEAEDDDSTQVWILPVDGGEALQVTSFEHGARAVEWSPVSANRLLVTAPVAFDEIEGVPPWPLEAPQRTWKDLQIDDSVTPRPDGTREEIRAWLARNAKDQTPRVINRINFQGETSLRSEMRFNHLFIVQLNAADAEPRRITRGFFDHDDAVFMPDGQRILYSAQKTADRHPDRVFDGEIYMVSLDGRSDRQRMKKEGWRLRSPKPNREGTMVAFIGVQTDEPTFRQRRLGLASLTEREGDRADQREIVWLTDQDTLDASVRAFEWLPARTGILFSTAIEGSFPLMRMSEGLIRPAMEISEVGGLPAGVHAFGAGGGAIVYAATTAANPCVLRVRLPGEGGDRLVMDLNEWVANRKVSVPTEHWITRPDGTRVQYWLMEPTARSSRRSALGARPEQREGLIRADSRQPTADSQRYPLLLQIHGGPQAMWGPGEMSMWHEFQLFCAWGYGVVYSNPRGSSGYGYAFQRANFQNWGEGPAGDVLAVVDHALLTTASEWADRDRLVVTGGSYAGYLTAWIVGHDHRFKAAVAQRGVYHLPTFFGEGNAWRLVPWAMGGPPFDARYRAIAERESPFTYVSRIRTPLLIMHADNDLRTGVSQSEMMYRALKYLERPVEYIRYPGEGHDLSRSGDPKLRMDRLNRMIDFFERHIENPAAAPVRTE